MAIERVPYPSSPPASDSDWTLLLSLISTMALNANGTPIKVVSGNIVKGSWFQIGGTFYLATADTAITGTASDYVKITPSGSTASAAYVADLSGVSWSDTYNGYYDGSGNLYVFDELSAMSDGEITEYKLDVGANYEFAWGQFFQIGNSLSISGTGTPSLAALSGSDVAFIDSDIEELRTYRFNGSTWSLVGSGLSISGIGSPVLAALNATDIAFIDSLHDEIRTYRFNGSTWSQVGSGLSISGIGFLSLAALNGTDVAFIDGTLEELRTYRFNGSTWSQVGSGLSISGIVFPALSALNGTDVAFIDNALEELRTYRFNGSTWSQVGSGLSISGIGYPALAALNGTDVAFIDGTLDELRTYRANRFATMYPQTQVPYSVSGGAF